MRVVYFGTADFAVPALRAIAPYVSLVVSQPDRPKGRGLQMVPSPVKQAALELGLPVETPEKSRAPEFLERLRPEGADLNVVAAYGQILSQAVLDSARNGSVNLHGSILPLYRGAAPIQRCIQDGHTETGITLMQMDRGMDTGDVIAISRLNIGDDETAGELTPRLASLAAKMIEDWLQRLVSGNYPRLPQNHALATHAAKVTKDEAELQLSNSADEEYRRFRAFTPAPGCFLRTRFGVLKISEARLSDASGQPGTALGGGDGIRVAFTEGSLDLLAVQPEGKKRMSGRDFANGFRLSAGTPLRL